MNSCVKFATNKLLQQVQKSPKNVAISPVSLSAVVAMLGAGSSGQTLDKVLKFTESQSLEHLKSGFSKTMSNIANSCSRGGGPKISFVNGAWVDQRFPLKPSYGQCLRDTFNTEATTKDFLNHKDEAVKEINSWAEQKTSGIIKNIISKGQISDPLTAAVLANALYFKGAWSKTFDARVRKDRDFYLDSKNKVSKVPFMTYSRQATPLYGSFPDFNVVELPYRKGKNSSQSFSMQIMLPHQKDGLQNMIKNLDANPDFLRRPFQLYNTELDVFKIPKFKFSFDLDNVIFPFMEGGMDISEMLQFHPSEPSLVDIFQKAYIEVDEQGTEAAAVTRAWMVTTCARGSRRDVKKFVADHPFMFIIKEDKSGAVLFTGAVLNPLLQN